jgi:hypothetical protein
MSMVTVDSYEAVGGPAIPVMGWDGFEAGPTDEGTYVVAYCAKHRSSRYRNYSSIPWGTPLRENNGSLEVFINKRWQSLAIFSDLSKDEILDEYGRLYNRRTLPSTWVFNDFGHLTCYFFKDLNDNGKLDWDKGEYIHGEFMHTTPDNEAETALSRTDNTVQVILFESHGCIHVKPDDIDDMKRKGYLQRGYKIYIHKYSDTIVLPQSGLGQPPFELHFYPGMKKIIVKGNDIAKTAN